MAEEEARREFYEKVMKESKAALIASIPSILLSILAAILIWLFGRLVFLPIASGIHWHGYPLPQILNLIILVALAVLVARILIDIRRTVDAVAGIAACEIGAPYDVSTEEIEHYRVALRSIFYVIAVSLIFLLFADYLARIHPALSAVVLIGIVSWSIYQIYRAVRALSEEIRRYASRWAERIG